MYKNENKYVNNSMKGFDFHVLSCATSGLLAQERNDTQQPQKKKN